MAVTTSTIVYEKRDQVVSITMNRPEQMNSLNTDIVNGIHDAFVEFRDDPDALVCIFTGAGGRSFSAGADLKQNAQRRAAQESGEDMSAFQEARSGGIPSVIRELDVFKPIIAAIDGYCLAGGLELGIQCDIRIATAHSQFGFPNARWNIMPPRDIVQMTPHGEALYLLLTGNRIDAETALRNGIIHSIHPDRESLMEEANRIAGDVKLCGPLAIQATKQLLKLEHELPAQEFQKQATVIQQRVSQSDDSREGPKAFSERRQPQWTMR